MPAKKKSTKVKQAQRQTIFNGKLGAEFDKTLLKVAKLYIADMVLRDGTRFGDMMLENGESVDRVIRLLRDPPLEDQPGKKSVTPFGISI